MLEQDLNLRPDQRQLPIFTKKIVTPSCRTWLKKWREASPEQQGPLLQEGSSLLFQVLREYWEIPGTPISEQQRFRKKLKQQILLVPENSSCFVPRKEVPPSVAKALGCRRGENVLLRRDIYQPTEGVVAFTFSNHKPGVYTELLVYRKQSGEFGKILTTTPKSDLKPDHVLAEVIQHLPQLLEKR